MADNPYHPVTMPEAIRWFQFLSARLRHVRILNGDWRRTLTTGATKTVNVRMKGPDVCGVFLDPPYGAAATRDADIYTHDTEDIAPAVLEWCQAHGDDPDYRVVLAGFEQEHDVLEQSGWRAVEWFKKGFLSGGMGNVKAGGNGGQQHRERLWLSPHCLRPEAERQGALDLGAVAEPVLAREAAE